MSENSHNHAAQYAELPTDERQIEATLAQAYEQRTANLIALYSAADWENKLTTPQWDNVAQQITERLGL